MLLFFDDVDAWQLEDNATVHEVVLYPVISRQRPQGSLVHMGTIARGALEIFRRSVDAIGGRSGTDREED
jgi:hypothetical protein